MKLFGITLHQNLLAVLLGFSIILFGLLLTYYFQKNIFSRYKRKASNASSRDDQEP